MLSLFIRHVSRCRTKRHPASRRWRRRETISSRKVRSISRVPVPGSTSIAFLLRGKGGWRKDGWESRVFGKRGNPRHVRYQLVPQRLAAPTSFEDALLRAS